MHFRRKNIRLHPIHYRGRRWFFITICCDARRAVFSNGKRVQNLIECLKTTATSCQFAVHAYCVMPDHFHMLVEGVVPESDLLLFVRKSKQASSRDYSKNENAPLWQKKFYDHILRPKDSPEAVSWYIWMNPVRKGLCTLPDQYSYSGSFTERWEKKVQPRDLWAPPWKTDQVARPQIGRPLQNLCQP
jgi:putative transposase